MSGGKSDMPLIGFCGVAGSGKSTAALRLESAHGFSRIRFAGPLKDMMAALGLTYDEVEGSAKEKPCELLCGKTPRQAMQWLGTEWGRDLLGPDFWARAWARAIEGHGRVVVDDVRFENEAAAIRERRGLLVRIDRAGAGSETGGNHSSERLLVEPDLVLVNDGDLAALNAAVDALARNMTWGRR